MELEIKKGKNKFYIGNSEEDFLCEITFLNNDKNNIIINHTYVSANLRGQGIAKNLVDEVVKLARTRKVKIIPLCTYAKKVLEENIEYTDVLFKGAY